MRFLSLPTRTTEVTRAESTERPSGAPSADPSDDPINPIDDPIYVLDTAVTQIDADLAQHPHERGAVLLGSRQAGTVCEIVYDRWASTTAVSYVPSLASSNPGGDSIEAVVGMIESNTSLEYLGTAHSHPPGLARPSGQDLVAFADTLRQNPGLPRFEGPIVTRPTQGAKTHGLLEATGSLVLEHGLLSWFTAERSPDGVACAPRPVVVLHLGAAVHRLTAALRRLGFQSDPGVDGDEEEIVWQPRIVNGTAMVGTTIALRDGRILDLAIWPALHPLAAPVAMLIERDGRRRALPLAWDLARPEDERLSSAVTAALAGLTPSAAELRRGRRARLDGAVPESIEQARIAVVGAGSVGSMLAEAMVRSGVGAVVLVDPDAVGPENLSRSTYCAADVGAPKVDALAARLLAIRPDIEVERVVAPVDGFDLAAHLVGPEALSLVVAATDDPRAQSIIDHHCYQAGVPGLFPAVYAKGHGGEVVFTVPELTRCYRCATSIRHGGAGPVAGGHDYGASGGGRLVGEVALGSDIAQVTHAAVKVGLALMCLRESRSALVDGFLVPSMVQGPDRIASMVQFSTVPDVAVEHGGSAIRATSLFPATFAGVAGQGAWQSAWLTVVGDPRCRVCGPVAARSDPGVAPSLVGVNADDLASALSGIHMAGVHDGGA